MAPPRTSSVTRNRPSALGFAVLAIGVWLTVASFVLGYEEAGKARVAESAIGAALIVLSVLHLLAKDVAGFVPKAIAFVGFALFIAPFVVRYGYLDRPVLGYLNSIVMALLTISLGVLMAKQQDRAR